MPAHHTALLIATFSLLLACTPESFGSRPASAGTAGAPMEPRAAAHHSIQPASPSVQPNLAQVSDPAGGFDIRLVRVQPSVHLNTLQSCDVIYSGRPEAIDENAAERYPIPAVQRMAIKCQARTGESWADLIFTREHEAEVHSLDRGQRVRIRILAADGGYVDYPIVAFVATENERTPFRNAPQRATTSSVPNGFNLRLLQDEPTLIGTTQQCAIASASEIDIVRPNDRRRNNYPAGVQNRLTVHCKHSGGEEPADLVFMPAQALAALRVRRGASIPVRIISRHGGFVDYPVLQFAGR